MLIPALFGSIGYAEVLIILFVLLIVFGTRLPEVARSLGKSLSQFRKGMRELERDVADQPEEPKEEKKEPPAG